jgi:hypothetical protein
MFRGRCLPRIAGMTATALIPDDVAATIADLQRRVNEALVAGDAATLERLVAPDCQIVGPKGFMIGRDQWIKVRQGGYDYEQLFVRPIREHLVAYDNAAIRCDVIESACTFRGERIDGLFRVTQAWLTRGGRWQLAAVQYTSLRELPADETHTTTLRLDR